MAVRQAYRIETERLVLRCYEVDDAAVLLSQIHSSLDHLKKWMPWAASEPTTLSEKTKLIEKFRTDFLNELDFNYGIFLKKSGKLVGSCGLHKRSNPNALEIGYWIGSSYLSKGYATEITNALRQVAFEIKGVKEVEIQCDPNNLASKRIPEKLGFKLIETVKNDKMDPSDHPRDTEIWRSDISDSRESINLTIFNSSGELITSESD